MERIYYSRQNYYQLKRKQYEEYVIRRNRYYLYKRKQYEDYIKNQHRYRLYKRKQYEEYIKKQNRYYLYRRKYYKEYLERQNRYYLNTEKYREEFYKKKYNKINAIKSEFFNNLKSFKAENNYINSQRKENNIYDTVEDSHNGGYLVEKTKETIKEKKAFLEEGHKEYLGVNDEEYTEEYDKEVIEEAKQVLQNTDKEYLKENHKKGLDDINTNIEEGLSEKSNTLTESLYIMIPIILTETNITISVEDTITLAEKINTINRIKMKVFLTKSHLIPYSSSLIDSNSGILFVTGFIRKYIEYEIKNNSKVSISNNLEALKHCTVEVPFNFTTRIGFLRPPIFIKNTTSSELEFLCEGSQEYNNYEDTVIGYDYCEKSFMFTEVFNEKPFVELVKVNFIEVDINKDIDLSQDDTKEQEFTKIKGKTILNLILRVLQEQQVRLEVE